MPGSMPRTSQLDCLISMTAMIVLFWSRATRDLLKSFGWGIGALHRFDAATKLPFPRRPPHSISRSRDRRDLSGSATRAALWRSEGKEKSDHHSVRASQGAIVVKQNQEIAPEG